MWRASLHFGRRQVNIRRRKVAMAARSRARLRAMPSAGDVLGGGEQAPGAVANADAHVEPGGGGHALLGAVDRRVGSGARAEAETLALTDAS